ncbi:MipA/OmpV family protein [Roseibium denhamense]|uniref:Outer membrane scaffolding protein for murein synthesis, MipA/OmpV family n=1 Tax=Roseibium denhamense TaxID=76305 RepID=A0ABY1P8S4_9HYPH|nr:MipA/OmpV family protein [Roseibium denhamense]MTI07338.1 MipA/OmpV family protein [Roseibium denhamense]SMP28931.1 Outer membrane scaffolding protein for murein synthesis, MipA/OmpV family [Roseibium denhamense]
MYKFISRLALALAAGLSSGSAMAQSGELSAQDAQKQFVIDLGVGAIAKPRYEASDSYLVYPFPIISVGRFYLPGLGQVVDGRRRSGIFFYPAFNFIGERKASDSTDLTGTRTVDWALELGLGGGFRTDHFRAFAELRQGINGHTGQVGQLGLDGIIYPAEKWEVSFGPRADFASGEYMDTYFGVTASEAANSGGRLSRFDPSAGFKSVGLSARASYDWNDDVRLHIQGGYDRLIGDAADSPIAKVGSEDQFSIGVGLSYRFAFDVF